LRSEPGHNLDDQIDLVGQQRIQVNEGGATELRQGDLGTHPSVVSKLATVGIVKRAELFLGRCVLCEYPLASNLRDVRRLKMNLRLEPVHQSGELDPRIVETAYQLAELLL